MWRVVLAGALVVGLVVQADAQQSKGKKKGQKPAGKSPAKTPVQQDATLLDLKKQLEESPNDPQRIVRYVRKAWLEIKSKIDNQQVAEAATDFANLKKYLAELGQTIQGEAAKRTLEDAIGSLDSLEMLVRGSATHEGLIGKDVAPMKIETWINGSPIADGDLKGKMVLLDFWGVWCNPSLDNLPILRQWNDKYGDKGLDPVSEPFVTQAMA